MFGAVPTHIVKYFGHIIRILQKLLNLSGWPEFIYAEDDLNDETEDVSILFVGVMFGFNSASTTITKVVQSAARKTEIALTLTSLKY